MREHILIGLSSVLVLGIIAQWAAWRVRLPAILMLLLLGIAAGAGMRTIGWHSLDPDALLGDLLYPLISLSVAVILFEGGLTLHWSELKGVGHVVGKLCTLGALVTWSLTTLAARFTLSFDWTLAVLLGAILVVTGPTVVGPLLRHVRPTGRTGPILKWEGIVIDPVGATLALLVFEMIIAKGLSSAGAAAALILIKTLIAGGAIGFGAAALLVLMLRRYWIADYLQNPVTLALVVAAYTLSGAIQAESGLFAVTVMGIALANQRLAPIAHILEFKESLVVLLVSALFILLSARIDPEQISELGLGAIFFVVAMVLIVRPASVFLSTLGSGLQLRERLFIAWMAPRGIVAAAVSSIFSLRLREAGFPQADRLAPITFVLIIATVALYGLTAVPVARRLGLRKRGVGGFLIIGANPLSRALAEALAHEDQRILLVDSNRENVAAARMAGLSSVHASALSDTVSQRIDLSGLGRLLALTPNDEVNALAALHFGRVFGRSNTHQLAPATSSTSRTRSMTHDLHGRILFGDAVTYAQLNGRLAAGAVMKRTVLSREFDMAAYRAQHGPRAVPLFVVDEVKEIHPLAADLGFEPRPGQVLISLVDPAPNPAVREPSLADVVPAQS